MHSILAWQQLETNFHIGSSSSIQKCTDNSHQGRKLRCDGNKPTCNTCRERGETCTWDNAPRRRGPGKKPRGQSVMSTSTVDSREHPSTPQPPRTTETSVPNQRPPRPAIPTTPQPLHTLVPAQPIAVSSSGRQPAPIPSVRQPPMPSISPSPVRPLTTPVPILPPIRSLGLIPGQSHDGPPLPPGSRPGEGEPRWLSEVEVQYAAASTAGRVDAGRGTTPTRPAHRLQVHPPAGRYYTQSRGRPSGPVPPTPPRHLQGGHQGESDEDSEDEVAEAPSNW
jgi:hypothetical protein